METKIYYTSHQHLSHTQEEQLSNLCEEFQPHYYFDEVVFLKVLTIARRYCDGRTTPIPYNERLEVDLSQELQRIKDKYYFDGIRRNGKRLDREQYNSIDKYVPRIGIGTFTALDHYRPVEAVLFIKLVRACRDLIRSNIDLGALPLFFDRLTIIQKAMSN